MMRRLLLGSEWRRDVLRTNLWLVPAVEVLAAAVLFACTYAADRAAYDGKFALPGSSCRRLSRESPVTCPGPLTPMRSTDPRLPAIRRLGS
jgi:hypothetical protein